MKRLIIFLGFLVCASLAHSDEIASCDHAYKAEISSSSDIRVTSASQMIGSRKLNFTVTGGVFSLDKSMLVAYGPPHALNPKYPQATYLEVFYVRRNLPVLLKQAYGGGIYSVKFSANQRFAIVESQFGVDVIDLNSKRTSTHDVTYMPPFPVEECSNG